MRFICPSSVLILLAALPVYTLGFAVRGDIWSEGLRLVLAATAFGLGPALVLFLYHLPGRLK
jgi:hypothetical protein